MTWSADIPYNDLPPLPPTAAVESVVILRSVIEARSAVAALDQATRRMPNPAVLINSIPILEAQASSEIENIVTTTDELFRNALDVAETASPETKETLRYRTALFAGLDSIRRRPLSVTTAREICTTVQGREMDVRRLPGTVIANPATRRAIYTPPVGESHLRDLLGNWEDYLHRRDGIDPLIRMAITHYQFEAIHPFADGNGRTGRILNILMLVEAGLLESPVMYLSRYIIRHKDDYYRNLLEVTRSGAWEEWILFILDAVRATAQGTLIKVDLIQHLQSEIREELRATTAGSNSDLLDVLFEQPYCRISNVIEACGVSRPTASKWLNELVARRILVDVRAGRERLFINWRFLDILQKDGSSPSHEPTLF
jgi:Fic family protein